MLVTSTFLFVMGTIWYFLFQKLLYFVLVESKICSWFMIMLSTSTTAHISFNIHRLQDKNRFPGTSSACVLPSSALRVMFLAPVCILSHITTQC